MHLQIACMRGRIVTLIALVWLFPTMCFQMSPQMAYLRGCIFTLVAFVYFFSAVCYQMYPQSTCLRRCIITLATFSDFSPLCVFKCLLILSAQADAKPHWLHLFFLWLFFVTLMQVFVSSLYSCESKCWRFWSITIHKWGEGGMNAGPQHYWYSDDFKFWLNNALGLKERNPQDSKKLWHADWRSQRARH